MTQHPAADKDQSLEGRRAVITGAAGGIALATARAFARRGARLLLTDLDAAALETAAHQLTGHDVVLHAGDLTRRDDVDAIFAAASDDMGGVDILVNCAGGYTAYATFEEIDERDWDRVIDVNLKSVYLSCKAVIPLMKFEGWGRIINLGSLAGRSTSAGSSPAHYATAKAGVAMLTQYIAKDVAPHGHHGQHRRPWNNAHRARASRPDAGQGKAIRRPHPRGPSGAARRHCRRDHVPGQ